MGCPVESDDEPHTPGADHGLCTRMRMAFYHLLLADTQRVDCLCAMPEQLASWALEKLMDQVSCLGLRWANLAALLLLTFLELRGTCWVLKMLTSTVAGAQFAGPLVASSLSLFKLQRLVGLPELCSQLCVSGTTAHNS